MNYTPANLIYYDCFEISPCSLGNISSFVFHFPAGHVKRRVPMLKWHLFQGQVLVTFWETSRRSIKGWNFPHMT